MKANGSYPRSSMARISSERRGVERFRQRRWSPAVKRLMRAPMVSVLLLGLAHSAAAQPPPAPVDLISHEAVLIRAASSKVWPHILDPHAWKQGAALVPLPAPDGRVRFKAVMPDHPETVVFYAEQIELIDGQRRTMRLNTVDGTLIGYSSWVLTPQPGATLVEYHVYSTVDLGQPAANAAERLKLERDYRVLNQQRFLAELEALKRLVEASEGEKQ